MTPITDIARSADALLHTPESAAAAERCARDNVVGIRDIAERAGVSAALVNSWRKRAADMTGDRGIPMPEPAGSISGRIPWWWWPTIREWLHDTGRLD